MGGHGIGSEGGLRGEHTIYVTKEGTFAVCLRNESTQEEVRGIFLTKTESVPQYTLSMVIRNDMVNVP
jgi:hypothetical protein